MIDCYFLKYLIKTAKQNKAKQARQSKAKQATYKMTSLIVGGAVAVVVGVMLAKRQKKRDDSYRSYRDRLRASAAKAYAYQQSLIIEAEMREEAMNKLSIYEQEVIKEIELEIKLDDLYNAQENKKMEAERYRNFMENTPEYKEMLKKYKN